MKFQEVIAGDEGIIFWPTARDIHGTAGRQWTVHLRDTILFDFRRVNSPAGWIIVN